MPLTKTGKKIREHMREFYGPEKGDRVFYATENKLRSLEAKRRKRKAKHKRKKS
jgi:hypothetical protein